MRRIEMVMNSRWLQRMNAGLVAVLAVGALASCGPMASSPQQVQASSPTVTYNYRSDQELVQANRNATTFCGQYQTTPRTATIANNPDGSRTVVFECVRTASAPPAPSAAPGQSYTYRTDQELVQASQSASAYCMSYGSQPMTSSIVNNPDGTRTVTFRCGGR
jgi:hypothetical protein